MSLRRTIVEICTEELNVTEFCSQHGISTWFFYDLRRRYAAQGEAALEPRSRAPRRVANKTPEALEDVIVRLRKDLLEEGLDAGPGTIAFHLADRGVTPVPSDATIWRVLRRRGFVRDEPAKAPKKAVRRFAAGRANECWQHDDTAWALADGTPIKIINVVDDCTRVLIASVAVTACTAQAVFATLSGGADEWGWPERILSDNALAHHALHDAFHELGIEARHPRPYHPQTCGKVERFHQTLTRYLTAQPAADTLAELQAQLDTFRAIYNHQRPHRALGRRIPAQVWADTPKSGPRHRRLDTPTRTRTITVATNGAIDVGRRYRINIGRHHADARSIVVTTGTACHVFIEGRPIRHLTLDDRRYYPNKP